MRRLLLLLIVLGSLVSIAASGRLTARLAVDGIVAFAFIPVIEILSFAAIWPRVRTHARQAGMSFGRAFDVFAGGDSPWLFWLLLLILSAAAIPPREIGPWAFPLLLSSVVPFGLTMRPDLRFFHDTLRRPPAAARADLVLLRAGAWTAGMTYFLGIAIRAEIVPRLHAWFGA